MNVFLQLFSTVFMGIPLKISSGWKHTRKVRYAQYLQDQGSVMLQWLADMLHFPVPLELTPSLNQFNLSQNPLV